MTPALLILSLCLAPAARATQIQFADQPCPIDPSDTVRVYSQVSSNNQGGYDSDGATYSTQGQFRSYAISTCPQTLFSLYGGDTGMDLGARDLVRLTAVLSTARSQLSDPVDPPIWERYGIAAQVYASLGRGPSFLADLWLEASWTARDQAVGVYVGLRGPEAAREILRLGELELSKDISAEQRKTLVYNLARVAHRGGFNMERDRWLTAFDALAPHSPAEQQALDRFRHMTADVEPGLQDHAIQQLRLTVADHDLPAEQRLRSTYLLADLLRRRDQTAEALPLFQAVLKDGRSPDELRTMAQFLQGELAP